MTARKTAVVVLAAGKGTRMKSSLPKVLHPIAGRAMVHHVLHAAAGLSPERTLVVLGKGMEPVARAVAPALVAVQDPPLGTGHAVLAAAEALDGFDGDVVVVFADTPLVTLDTFRAMLDRRRAEDDPAIVVLGFRPANPGAYGRLVVKKGKLKRIVEAKDADEDERAIGLCNAGLMVIDGRHALDLLRAIGCENANGEYYLTDIVAIARERGLDAAVVEAAEDEVMGVNSRAELARAEAVWQARRRLHFMDEGVTLTDPATVFFSADTVLGRDVTIGPNVVFGPGVSIEDGVRIDAFCHIEGAHVASGARIGPFARLRPGADIGEDAHIGNFVEIKKSVIGKGAKANHLAYIGDARVGAQANIGAGTITCNYDGFNKHLTEIGEGAFIGSNSSLVAPVKIGDGALVGAGSTITSDVDADAIAVTRAPQKALPQGAAKFRARNARKVKG
ncbi:bifunctional UDP-N-acetylglucosamine diphosphorylase/glucosamine-1-phosphate N-acetyltransferase GlmU [Iodidimonas sp. SYSU 1G8]|uniref:bifunctional UDP-N-acetylglucosamine diphosphorylase/glucosamine-1-phosphate N-acetyltransferase GlmU n=1 Tax=Iodidimonas sp. SYSU 1G8 TaxID=3133967 RepID=UPI0031FF0DE7